MSVNNTYCLSPSQGRVSESIDTGNSALSRMPSIWCSRRSMIIVKEMEGGSQWVLSGRATASLWEGVGLKSQLTAQLAGSPWTGSFPSPSPSVLICKNGDAGWLGLLTEWVALKCLASRHPASRHSIATDPQMFALGPFVCAVSARVSLSAKSLKKKGCFP